MKKKKPQQNQNGPVSYRPHKDICQNLQIRFLISFISNAFFVVDRIPQNITAATAIGVQM